MKKTPILVDSVKFREPVNVAGFQETHLASTKSVMRDAEVSLIGNCLMIEPKEANPTLVPLTNVVYIRLSEKLSKTAIEPFEESQTGSPNARSKKTTK